MPGSHQIRALRRRPWLGTPRVPSITALALLAGGCTCYHWAEITPVRARPRRADLARPASSAPEVSRRAVLDSSTGGGRTELRLLHAALGLAGAAGHARTAEAALAHFRTTGALRVDDRPQPPVLVRVRRGDRLGDETWLVDTTWVCRRLEGGAVLAREGDFGTVTSTLMLLLPAARPPGP